VCDVLGEVLVDQDNCEALDVCRSKRIIISQSVGVEKDAGMEKYL
jgi:hypothetical protein